MRMEKRKFRIGELAKHLNVERFVIRFWEKEFTLKTVRSSGGQRFYNHDDLLTFKTIKELLYHRGFTIAGARRYIADLKQESIGQEPMRACTKTTLDSFSHNNELYETLTQLRKKLTHLQKLL